MSPVSSIGGCAPICPSNRLRMTALTYMPFYKFDDVANITPNVYNIVMNLYNDIAQYESPYIYDQQMYLGLSEVVAAQWDKECFNLALYNRNLTYAQDFFAKNILTVEPTGGPEQSFADPIINEPEFTIEPGVNCEMRAGNKIIVKPGSHAKQGCHFHAYIDPTLTCYDNKKMLISNSTPNQNDSTKESPKQEPEKEKIKENKNNTVFECRPNPFNNSTQIIFSIEETTNVRLYITSIYGIEVLELVNNELLKGIHNINIKGSALSSGIYLHFGNKRQQEAY